MALSVGRATQCESNRPHMAAKRDALPPLRRWVTAAWRNEERPKRLVTARRDGRFLLERLTMGTTRPSPDARSALVDCATTILDAAQSAGVVPAGACLIVAVGDADAAAVLASGDARASVLALQTIAAKTPELITEIRRKTGN